MFNIHVTLDSTLRAENEARTRADIFRREAKLDRVRKQSK